MESDIIFKKKGRTAYVILNRPERRNAINLSVRKKLCKAWKEIDSDPDIRSAIVTGGEKVFSAGQDMIELSEFREKDPFGELPLNNLETFGAYVKKPVIVAVSGYCLGAGFLITMVGSDIRVASNTAIFGMPEVKVGVPPGLGIIPILSSHFSSGIFMELMMLGNNITAEDAYRVGFINKIVSPKDLLSTAEEYANKIDNFSPLMMKNIKEVFRNVTTPDSKSIALSDAICKLGRHSEDYGEGIRAFKEKRAPVWKDR